MGGRMIDEQEEENREVLQHSPSKRERILVLYASQTGNAMDAAERVGREAERRGCPSVAVLSMDEYDASCLPREHVVIFVVSTTGQGDIPDSMKVFWRYLLQRNLSREWLAAVHYAVFGLGDSGYQKYNYAAKKLDKRLSDIGGKPLIEKGLGDDQHPSGYEGTFDPWLSSLWNMVHLIKPSLLPSDSDIIGSQRTLESPKFQIIYHSADQVQMQTEDALDLVASQKIIGKARSMSPGKFRYIDERPQYLLRMVTNQRLSEVGQEKDVRHFEFESLTSVLDYKSGDVLEVLPCQNLEAVDNFIRRCNLDPDVYITVLPKKRVETSQFEMQFGKKPVKLKKIVELTMDVASASPRRYFFEVMSFFATAEHERERLQYFSSPEGRDDLYQYNQKERRTVLEVLEDFPSVNMSFEWLVQLVPPLKTRGFSISSSPLAHPREVHLTVSVVSWRTPFKRERFGLCSSWLASLDPKKSEGVYIPAWIHPGALPPPKPSIPLILVGPGTGCAPFHAFIEERAVQSASQSTAPIIFFFGCRNEHSDFLYRDFWLSHAQDPGVLSAEKGGGFFVAFSRDQPHKVYVQHKMKEESARVWNLLSSGASIYIAGSSDKMPADVTSALEDIVSEEGGVPKETAARWLKQQERAGKFYIEAWS